MTGLEYLAVAAAALAGLGALESVVHRRRLARIPTRVHVSGTRGKSSVTRLVAAALREAGVPTAAKTTGTLARMILPDGAEVQVFRPAGPNILEQMRIVSTAAELGAQVMVVECMALQPELHWVSEHRLIRATHGVITNARPDHLDVMGPTDRDVALCLAGMIPVGGKLFTAEQKHLDVLRRAAEDRKTRLIAVGPEEVEAVTEEELAGFRYVEHAENVALSLAVLEDLGVDRATALSGMWKAPPDPGVMSEHVLDFFGRRIVFVNGFAANDPQSTRKIWQMARARHSGFERCLAVFNLRADRPSRTIQLAVESDFWHEADGIILMGTGAYLFARLAARAGVDVGRFVHVDHSRVEEVFEAILESCGLNTLVVGMANIGGPGLALVRHFRNRALPGERMT